MVNNLTRTDIINGLIKKFGYKSYLEIGTQNGVNYDKINCVYKVGVDPEPSTPVSNLKIVTSDDFFETNEETFDIIFIDGLHHADQVYKDINNSLRFLKENGTIVCHDINPINEDAQIVPRKVKVWNGDCWKAWVAWRHSNLEMFVIDTDFGVGIIRKDKDVVVNFNGKMSKFKYKDLIKNRKKILNLIPVSKYKKWLHDTK